MKHISFLQRGLLLALLATSTYAARAQGVGIGTTAPNASAALDVVSSTKGALLPRLTSAQRTAIASPATGLIVFQTDGTPGYYFNAGTPAAPAWQQLATAAGTATGFVQNQNAVDQAASFRVSGTGSTLGNFGIGTSAPQLGLDAAGAASSIGLRNNAAWDHMYLFHDGATAYLRAGGAENGLSLQVGAGGAGTYGDAAQSYREALRLLPSGNVGIGTSAPAGRLQVVSADNAIATNIVDAQAQNLSQGVGLYYSGLRKTGTNANSDLLLDSKGTGNVLLNTNGGTGNVGIGTISPAARLHARGAGNAPPAATGSAQSVGLISRFQTSDNAILDLGGNSGNGFWLQSTDIVNLGTNYPLMLNPNGGNVGIGTTNPGTRLDVVGAGSGNIDLRVNGRLQTGDGNNAGGVWLNSANSQFVGQYDATKLGFYNNGNWRMVVDNAGNMGIGTSAPSQKLEVAGQVFSSTGGFRFPDNTTQTTAATTTAPTTASNGLTKTGNDIALGGTLTQNTTLSQGANFLQFTSTGTGNPLYVDANSNGLTRSVFRNLSTLANSRNDLAVLANGAAVYLGVDNASTLFANGPYTYLDNRSGGRLAFGTSGAEQLTLATSGSVGIGTTAPTVPLDVNGAAQATSLTARTSVFVDADNAGDGTFFNQTALKFGLGNTGEGIGSKRTATGNQYGLDFYTGYVSRLAVTNAGNVGIGTGAPVTTLDVRTADASAAITVGATDNTAGALYFGNPGHGVKRNYSGINDVGLYTTAANLYLAANGAVTSQFVLTNGGNVGIGTAAPAQRLDVTGGSIKISTAGQGLVFPDGTTQTTAATTTAATTASNGLTKTGNNIALGGPLTAATDVPLAGNSLTFSGAGNVGIGGSAAPTQTLDVTGTAIVSGNVGIGTAPGPANQLRVANTQTTSDPVNQQHSLQLEVRQGSSNKSMALGVLPDGTGMIQAKETGVGYYPLLLNPVNGNVGIGTSSPATKLDVNGNVRVGAANAAGKVLTQTTGNNNMLAVAYGQLGSSGALVLSTSGNYTFARTSAGVYTLTFPASSGLSGANLGNAPVVVTVGGTIPSLSSVTGGTGFITVYTFNTSGTASDRIFNITVFAP